MPNKARWTEQKINALKSSVRDYLRAVQDEHGADARLTAISRKINELESATESGLQLERLIYCISALVHHERYGGLSSNQINKLTDMAHMILQVNGVKPTTSKLSFLYGDLHLILSQIFRKNGEHWRAAWEQQMSHHLALKKPSGGKSFQALSLGIRTLRIGFSNLAYEYLDAGIAAAEKGSPQQHLAQLHQLKALRLSGRLQEADDLLGESAKKELSDEMRIECEWETICRGVMRTHDLTDMLLATKRGHPHHQESYLCELMLWAYALQSTKWIERLPSISTLVKNKTIKPKRAGLLYQFAKQIRECYDPTIPFALRLKALGSCLCRTGELIAPDLELLAWLAASRWLYRNNTYDIANLAAKEYQSLSMRLSDGDLKDGLQIAEDLSKRTWLESAS